MKSSISVFGQPPERMCSFLPPCTGGAGLYIFSELKRYFSLMLIAWEAGFPLMGCYV